MQGPSLGKKINQPTVYANELLQLHHELYSVYWEWSERIMDQAVTKGVLQTVMGWKIRTPGVFNPRSIRNFMMQAHGAELLRLACCLTTEAGLNLCGPLHDALFIESPIDHIEEHVDKSQRSELAGSDTDRRSSDRSVFGLRAQEATGTQ